MKRNKRPGRFAASGNMKPQSAGPLFDRQGRPYANGDRACRAIKGRISLAGCIVQSCRHPAKCAGCSFEDKP